MIPYLPYFIIGGFIGVLASFAPATRKHLGILLNLVLGVAGAWLAGTLVPGGSSGDGIDLTSLLIASAGAIVLIGVGDILIGGRLR